MPNDLSGGSRSNPRAAGPTGGTAAAARDERVRDLAEALHEQQARVAAALGRLRGGERLDTRGRTELTDVGHFPEYAPELEWTASAVTGHLVESARVFLGRIEALRSAPDTVIADFDPYRNVDLWARQPVSALAEALRAAHAELVSSVRSLDEESLSTPGTWDDGTAVTLGDVVGFLPGHVGDHAAQLERMR